MKSGGFRSYLDDGQFMTDLVMPEDLSDIFFASLYCKGNIMDIAEGDPVKIWNNMSYKYNNINLVAPVQVHGSDIIDAEMKYSLPIRPEVDGILITGKSDCCASLRFADCVPVVIAAVYPDPWMLILHSGFSGTVKDITSVSISNVKSRFGVSDFKGKAWAWIGPCICKQCYCRRKDDPLTVTALKIFNESNFRINEDIVYFDLSGQIREQLIYSGVPDVNINIFSACTSCGHEYLYSYRAGDKKNRIFLLAGNAIK